MPRLNKILIVTVLNFLLLLAVSGVVTTSLDLKWKYSAPAEISALQLADFDGDYLSEIIFSSGNKIYILDRSGRLITTFTLIEGSKVNKRITALQIINSDEHNNSLLIGLGWMENFPVKESYFDNESKIKDEVMYYKTLQQGEIKLLDYSGNEIKSLPANGWVRDIWIAKLAPEEPVKIITASGGSNTFHYERIGIEDLNATNRTYSESSWVGSLTIRDYNLTLISENNYSTGIIWATQAADLYQDLNLEVLAVSSNKQTYCLSNNLTSIWNYSSAGEIRYLWAGDLEGDGAEEILIGFLANAFSSVEGLRRDGNKFLDFRLPLGEEIRGIEVDNLDTDEGNEIIITTDKSLHAFTLTGEHKSSDLIVGITHLQVEDTDTDGYPDIILTSGNELYCYEFSQEISKKRGADQWYEKAQDFLLRNYTLAKEYAEKAQEIYLELNDVTGIKNSRQLLLEVNQKLLAKKKNQAESLYAQAIILMTSNYSLAKSYAEQAREIYVTIDSPVDIENCDNLIREIDNFFNETTTTTTVSTTSTIGTTTSTTLVTTTTLLEPQSPTSDSYLATVIVVTLLIALLFLLRKRTAAREEKEEQEELAI